MFLPNTLSMFGKGKLCFSSFNIAWFDSNMLFIACIFTFVAGEFHRVCFHYKVNADTTKGKITGHSLVLVSFYLFHSLRFIPYWSWFLSFESQVESTYPFIDPREILFLPNVKKYMFYYVFHIPRVIGNACSSIYIHIKIGLTVPYSDGVMCAWAHDSSSCSCSRKC